MDYEREDQQAKGDINNDASVRKEGYNEKRFKY